MCVFSIRKVIVSLFEKKKIYEEAGEEKSITIFLYLEPNLHPSLKKNSKKSRCLPHLFLLQTINHFPSYKNNFEKNVCTLCWKNSLIQCILMISSPFVPKCSMLFHKKNSDCYHWEIWRRKYNLQNVYA